MKNRVSNISFWSIEFITKFGRIIYFNKNPSNVGEKKEQKRGEGPLKFHSDGDEGLDLQLELPFLLIHRGLEAFLHAQQVFWIRCF